MKKLLNLFLLTLIIAVFVLSCISSGITSESSSATPRNLIEGLDELIDTVAAQTVSIIPVDSQRTLAVYYFTTKGKTNDLSNYMINGLTTQIASKGKGTVTIVSRQALDQILSEGTFQLSSLVDEQAQVDIGKLLGADVILTGYITPVQEIYKLNVQLIEVETGVVIDGFIIDFILPEDLTDMIEKPDEVSEIIKLENKYVETGGAATITTVFEDFESDIIELSIGHFEEHWGDKIKSFSGKTLIEEGYAVYKISGEADYSDVLAGINDSTINYYYELKLKRSPDEFHGFSVRIKPEGFSLINIIIKQGQDDDPVFFGIPITLQSNVWQDIKIPFSTFQIPYEREVLKPEIPINIIFMIPYFENFVQYNFRSGNSFEGALLVDDPGFYKIKGDEDPAVIEHFEDEIQRAVLTSNLEGSFLYVDYSENDEDGILKQNEGVSGQSLIQKRVENGPSGRYLNTAGSLTINEKISDFYDDWQSLYLFLNGSISGNWEGFTRLSFIIRSDFLENGHISLIDSENEIYYSFDDISIGSSWSRIVIPFNDLITEGGSLAEVIDYPERFTMQLAFEINQESALKMLPSGKIDFNIDLDEFILE